HYLRHVCPGCGNGTNPSAHSLGCRYCSNSEGLLELASDRFLPRLDGRSSVDRVVTNVSYRDRKPDSEYEKKNRCGTHNLESQRIDLSWEQNHSQARARGIRAD